MLEKLIYKNHINETVDFGASGIFVNTNQLHNYSWDINSRNNKISNIYKGVSNKTLPVVIIGNSKVETDAIANRLMEVAEKDVLAQQYGRIIIGDYYMPCYITKSNKTDYLSSKRLITANLTVTTDQAFWTKETLFALKTGAEIDLDGHEYPHDYPYDYINGNIIKTINNTGFMPSNFRMNIYGACSNPSVFVAGHQYAVNADVPEGGYLTIDSVSKTITVTDNDGVITNAFKDRNKESYIFEKIPAGESNVTWEGDYSVDIVILQERSEPKWI